MKITMMASQSQIVRGILAFMLSWNNMLDVKTKRLLILLHAAIFAAIFRPLPNHLSQPGIHQAALDWASTRLALACKIPMSVLA